MCQLASSDQVATDAYKLTAKRLALGLEKVLCGQLNASNALPFSNYASANDNQMVGFGRLALMAYAHYLLGHSG